MGTDFKKEYATTWEKAYTELKKTVYEKEFIRKVTITSAILWWGFQIIYLTLMSPFYLRFFSVSQMISDSIFVVLSYGITILIYDFIKYIYNDNTLEAKIIKSQISVFLVLIPIILYIWYKLGIIKINLPNFDTFSSLLFVICLLYIYALLIKNIFLNYILPIVKKLGKIIWFKQVEPLHPYVQEQFKGLKIIMFIFILILSLKIFNSVLSIPTHFINQDNICSTTIDKHCKIRYFNDKYIFVEDSSGKIEIQKFDNFFN